MTSPISSISQGTQPLHPFFESIIQKKVSIVALTIFEAVVDFLCTKFYGSYNQRVSYCTSQFIPFSQKTHLFLDGAKFFDRTSNHRIELKEKNFIPIHQLSTPHLGTKMDQICLDGFPIIFSKIPNKLILFGDKYGTKEMYATDIKECPELVVIYEREVSGNLKAWSVDTTQKKNSYISFNGLKIGSQDCLIAEEIKIG